MDFTPNLSPKEIIRLGSFGGIYFYDEEGRIDINYKEFPSDWFEGLEESFSNSFIENSDSSFNVKSELSIKEIMITLPISA